MKPKFPVLFGNEINEHSSRPMPNVSDIVNVDILSRRVSINEIL
jgi:hypothetical protein